MNTTPTPGPDALSQADPIPTADRRAGHMWQVLEAAATAALETAPRTFGPGFEDVPA